MDNIEKLFTTKKMTPLKCFKINDTFLIGIYQGSISQFDILIKFRQMRQGKWSKLRTPKHIHWTVDVLIKMSHYPDETQKFIDFLLNLWENTISNKNEDDRNFSISINEWLPELENDVSQYYKLNNKGEYSIRFLVCLAKLLMQQEKNNLESAYMFKNLLVKLKEGKDIFSIISTSTHR